MADVNSSHEKVLVTYFSQGATAGRAVDAHILAYVVLVSNLEVTRVFGVVLHIRTPNSDCAEVSKAVSVAYNDVATILLASNCGSVEKSVPLSYRHIAQNAVVAVQLGSRTNDDGRPDNTVRSYLYSVLYCSVL